MSIEGTGLILESAKAEGAIVADSFVTIDASSAFPGENVVKQAGDGDEVYGINAYLAADGDPVTIVKGGSGKLLKLGAVPNDVTLGCQIGPDASGLGNKDTAALANIGAIALGASNVAGDYVPVEVTPHASVKAAS